MMIVIGLCDDELFILQALHKLLSECLKELDIECKLHTFQSGNQVLEKAEDLDILFLDVEMPDTDGYDVGKLLHKQNPECKIIMATIRIDRFREAFQIEAYDFIAKPFEKEEIKEVLDRATQKILHTEMIEVYRERNKYLFHQKDIQYIQAWDSYVEIMFQDGIFRSEESLNSLENILNPNIFFRINRRYIVNMKWITKYENGIITIGKFQEKVSIRKKKEFERKYTEYEYYYGY